MDRGVRPGVTATRFEADHAAEDARLVLRARGGDAAAFSRLYDRYSRMIHGILLARVSRLDVDDLVQDVFLAAWRRLDNLRDPGAFGGWLSMIARNRATDFHRSRVDAVALPDTLEAHDATAANAEASAALDVIRQLPTAYRETLILRLVEGMTGPEIASRTGLTAASVRVNLHRGMKLLREKLGERSGASGNALA
ncbi:MAG: sigma-70 family RNA polymerase sigma factor [Acidobacteria bacterium]|nr:sigma-70 family RNA polymerase sigma factor [Acidobacteriota bacterium]